MENTKIVTAPTEAEVLMAFIAKLPKATKEEVEKHLYSCGCGGCIMCAFEKHPDTLNF